MSASVPRAGISTKVLLVLALLSSLAPLGTDLYLSAFPQMVTDLHTSETGVQLSLTAFLLGSGLGQVVFGPLSDRFGRIRPLLVGLVIAVLAGVAAALAPGIQLLVTARLVQGMSAAAGMVIGRAMVTDLAVGQAAARAMSMLMVVGGVAPVVAPVLGSVLAEPIGWRGLLWIVASLSAFALVSAAAGLRETHVGMPARELSAEQRSARRRALGSRTYLGNTIAFAFAFATMMAYISASPFLYQGLMGMTHLQYGLAFGANALLLTAVSGVSSRLAGCIPAQTQAKLGLAINAVAIAAIMGVVLAGLPATWLIVPVLIAVGSLGLVFGNLTALALSAVREASGTGSAWLGLLQFGLAGAVAPLVSLGGEGTALPLAVTMLVATIVANVAFRAANSVLGRSDAAA